jgi:phosphate transport system ATP-binding protein
VAITYDIEIGEGPPALEARGLSVSYGSKGVVRDISLVIPKNRVVALVGPSGCGKSTLLRSFNRMNDLRSEASIEGSVLFHGQDIYGSSVDPVEVRRRIGMVFQRANPFPNSVFENVAFGPRVNGYQGDLASLVEKSLKEAALWDEVSERLFEPAAILSAGQQQRLCIARALAVEPEILLMDEPTSELDPAATNRIEALAYSLKEEYTIAIVSHDIRQAARISDYTAFLDRGELVEYGPTDAIFTNPREERTEAYITGRLE